MDMEEIENRILKAMNELEIALGVVNRAMAPYTGPTASTETPVQAPYTPKRPEPIDRLPEIRDMLSEYIKKPSWDALKDYAGVHWGYDFKKDHDLVPFVFCRLSMLSEGHKENIYYILKHGRPKEWEEIGPGSEGGGPE